VHEVEVEVEDVVHDVDVEVEDVVQGVDVDVDDVEHEVEVDEDDVEHDVDVAFAFAFALVDVVVHEVDEEDFVGVALPGTGAAFATAAQRTAAAKNEVKETIFVYEKD